MEKFKKYKIMFLLCILYVFITYLPNWKISEDHGIFNNSNISYTDCQPVINQPNFQIVIEGRTYPQRIPNFMNKSINFECLNTKSIKKKTILAWNGFFINAFYGYEGADSFKRNRCPVTNCELTNDKTRVSEAEYVIVHMRGGIDNNFPKERPSFQQWIFLLYESPVHSGDYSEFNGIFNLTSTYKTKSDFFNFYQHTYDMRWVPKENDNSKLNLYDSNRKFASALITNCRANSKRHEFIKEMRKHVSVDIFGKCETPCPQNIPCREYLLDNYKFYLAFENSFCEEYISEKFIETFKQNAIPVVRGDGDYAYYVSKLLT